MENAAGADEWGRIGGVRGPWTGNVSTAFFFAVDGDQMRGHAVERRRHDGGSGQCRKLESNQPSPAPLSYSARGGKETSTRCKAATEEAALVRFACCCMGDIWFFCGLGRALESREMGVRWSPGRWGF